MNLTKRMAAVAALTTLGLTAPVGAQSIGGLPGGGRTPPNAAAETDRVRAQVNQRVQAQFQAKIQAQLNSRVKRQVEARVAEQAAQAADVAERILVFADRQRASVEQTANRGVRLDAETSVRNRTSATAAGNRVQADAAANAQVHARVAGPSITSQDVEAFDSIFGQFNPLHGMNEQNAGTDQEVDNDPAAQANDDSTSRHFVTAESNLHFAARLATAVGQRRAHISELRDDAIATGNTQLLMQADAMENRLDTFLQAQGKIRSRAIATVDRTSSQLSNTADQQQRSSTAAAADQQASGDHQATDRTGINSKSQAEASVTADSTVDVESSFRATTRLNASAGGSSEVKQR